MTKKVSSTSRCYVPSAGGLWSDSDGCRRFRYYSRWCCRYVILGVYDPTDMTLHGWILTVTCLTLARSLCTNSTPSQQLGIYRPLDRLNNYKWSSGENGAVTWQTQCRASRHIVLWWQRILDDPFIHSSFISLLPTNVKTHSPLHMTKTYYDYVTR